jgi:ATP-binding cassette subfamily F protein uup
VATTATPRQAVAQAPARRKERVRKLGFNEKRELAELPSQIDGWETEVGELHTKMSNPDSYTDGTDLGALTARLDRVQAELASAYDRWTELQARSEEV